MKKLFIFDGDGVLLDLWGAMKSVYEQYTGTLLTTAEWDKLLLIFYIIPTLMPNSAATLMLQQRSETCHRLKECPS